ncbi:aminotransferase class IV [Chitinophaga horti]|uniref:branched-chain-amino-acid transaminase n=1 Tax=Chitinophaga horti TaxID=2920382 RepID=A0ABY6J1D6_9BACT|nr:aminotransferase class IV [Chitinophaga horti]UYQ93488.1 aminotransferase class IV [Chitinophaga horti]
MLLCHNGKFIPADKPFLMADNRSFRYGDGCFETMKVYQGQLLLADLHFERLMASLHILHIDPAQFTKDYISRLVLELCSRNNASELARVRLSVYRGGSGLYVPETNTPEFIIQSWELSRSIFELNETGLQLDVFPDARKNTDKLSNIKSNNSLPYILGGIYAKQHGLQEVIMLNPYGRVADTTIANIFMVKGKKIFTPPLSEGCVCGVMRKHILQMDLPFKVEEQPLSIEDLENADEIFLTNAVYGLRWVGRFRDSSYGNATATIVHDLLHEGVL